MNKTGIEYLTHTWNPFAMRCHLTSAGCDNCWHIRMADRMANNPKLPQRIRLAYQGKEPPVLVEKRLTEPLGLKKPAVIGVQFMGDLCDGDLRVEDIKQVFDVMKSTPQHIYLLLTKRPYAICNKWFYQNPHYLVNPGEFPKNIYLGITAENQYWMDRRMGQLIQLSGMKIWLSLEPLLGEVDITRWLYWVCATCGVLKANDLFCQHCGGDTFKPLIDWVVIGGETGTGARLMKPDWVYPIYDACLANSIPYFFKHRGTAYDKNPTGYKRDVFGKYYPQDIENVFDLQED